MSEIIRRFKGRVEIIYGKEEDAGNTEFYSYNSQNPSATRVKLGEDLSNTLKSLNVSNIEVPIFELNKHSSDRKPRILDSKRVYIGNVDVGSYIDLTYPAMYNNCLETMFAQPRPVVTWSIAGIRYAAPDLGSDIEIIELPTDFAVEIFYEHAVAAKYKCRYTCNLDNGIIYYDEHDYTNSSNTKDTLKKYQSTSEEVVLKFDTQNLTKVVKVVLSIAKWNVCKRQNGKLTAEDGNPRFSENNDGRYNWIKLTKSFDNKIETYDSTALTSFEINKQLSDSEGDINYGIVSNTFKATLLNAERKFDVGYLKDRVTMGKRVVPYIIENGNDHRLGTFYISSWKIPMDSSWVNIEAQDKLFELHDIIYPGFFPEKNADGTFKPVTMYQIIVSVLEFINDYFFNNLGNKHIDNDDLNAVDVVMDAYIATFSEGAEKTSLRAIKKLMSDRNSKNINYIGEHIYEGIDLSYALMTIDKPYIERKPVWDVLEDIAKSTMSYIYLDNNERLICHTDMSDSSYFLLDNDLVRINLDGGRYSVVSKQFEDTTSIVTPTNAYSMAKPMFRKAYATNVTVDYEEYQFGGDSTEEGKEIIKYYLIDIPPYKKDEDYVFYKFYVPEYLNNMSCSDCNYLTTVGATDGLVQERNAMYYHYKMPIQTYNSNIWKQSLVTILGVKIKSNKADLTCRVYEDVDHKDTMTYSTSCLTNNDGLARAIGDRLISLYINGREVFDTDWIGDISLDINKPIKFNLLHDVASGTTYKYRIASLNTLFDGGLQQHIKAVSYPKSSR